MPPEKTPFNVVSPAGTAPTGTAESPAVPSPVTSATAVPGGDTLTGTVTVRNANWKADYLAGHVVIDEATLLIANDGLRWDPVAFSYGPVKGTANLTLPADCPPQIPPQPCPAQFQVHFADLDAAAFESALLGAQEKGTLLSTLIDRFHPASAPPWPQLQGMVTADSLVLGPLRLEGVSVSLRILPTGAEITNLDAGLFGGSVHLGGTLSKPATDRDKPSYTLDGDFQKLNADDVGRLLGLRWMGGALSGSGNLELSGYTDKDLAASAKGALHFETRHGAVGNQPSESSKAGPVPAALGRFDRWTADAIIANGAIELGENQVVTGARKRSVEATITFGDPPTVNFPAPKEAVARRR